MARFSGLIFYLLIGGLLYYAWISVTPFILHEMLPNVPMQTVIGNKTWYFPMGYIEPHYENNQYSRGGETEVWLTMSSTTHHILPQNTASRPIGEVYDVILSSDRNPQTKAAVDQQKSLEKNLSAFKPAEFGLQQMQVGDTVEYLNIVKTGKTPGHTRISCRTDKCTLFTTRVPDVRMIMVFKRAYLAQWEQRINWVTVEIQPFRYKPTWFAYMTSIASTHPTGIQDDTVVPDVPTLHSNEDIPIDSMPNINHASARGSAEPIPLNPTPAFPQ